MSYNLNDDNYKEYVEMLCLANLPIEFYGKYIRHLTIKEIMTLGDRYSQFLAPFTISKDVFDGHEGKFYTLDVLLYINEYLDNSFELLKMLFDTDDIQVFGEEIIIDSELFIDKFKFEELTEVILKMFSISRYKKKENENRRILTPDKIEKIKDPREKSYQKRKYEAYMKEQREKNKVISLMNVYNTVVHFSDGKIDYNSVLDFNIYQLYNTFTILHKKENYRYVMSIATSGYCSDVKKLDLRPLSQQILTS